MITDREINDVYRLYLNNNNDQYLNKYSMMDESRNNKNWKWNGKDFPRVPALLDLEDYVKKYDLKSNNMLLFSENEPELEFIPHEKLFVYEYTKNNIDYDLHNLNIPENNYDFTILCQTLEHLYDPLLSLKNIYRYLQNDAYFFCNVPTINVQHMLPYNFYTGFTPVGLGCLFKQVGFKILEIGHWGNSDYLNKIFNNRIWPDYTQISTKNDFNIPCQTWILAKK